MEMSTAEKGEALSAHPLFRGVSRAGCLRLAVCCSCLDYRGKQTIAHPQDDRCAAFLVISGSVLVSTESRSGSETTGLFLASQGMLFGSEVLAGRAFPLMARSVAGPAVVLKIPADKAGDIFKDDATYYRNLSGVLAGESAHLLASLQNLHQCGVASRIARLILCSRQGAGRSPDTGTTVAPTLTHEEIATLVQSTRETTTLALGDFRKKGLICLEGRALVVMDRAGLARVAEKGS